MTECSIPTQRYFTACASLAALGVQFKHLDVFGPIHEMVKIEQKTVKHAPSDKLYDAFISLLAGAGGWWKSTAVSEPIPSCKERLAAADVLNSRRCNGLWTRVPPRT
jgi:hypothetical protein